MALPAGVTTFELQFGKSYDFSGANLRTDLTITPSREVRTATGDRVVDGVLTVSAVEGYYGSIFLPQPGQANLFDLAGNLITNFWYEVQGTDSLTGRTVGQAKRWMLQPTLDQTLIDLDVLPTDGVVGPVGSAVPPAVTSVNGQTGAVVNVAPLDGSSKVPVVNLPLQAIADSTELSATFVSRYATAATRAATAPFLAKLKRGEQDASYLYIGDSTGNATDEHVYLEAVALGARFPAYTVLYRLWNDAGGVYDAAVTIQTGTGARTLTVYNLSVSGKSIGYVLGARWAAGVAALTGLDLLFVSHSLNMGDPTPNSNGGLSIRWNFLQLTEEFAVQHPQAGIVLMSQNPTTISGRETWQAKKAQIIQELAAQRGYGFLDVHQAFVDYAAANSVTVDSLLVDQVHPGATGQAIWVDVVGSALRYSTEAGLSPRQPSAFAIAAPSITGNNTAFTEWTGTNPDGWTVTNATLAKDTTNYETGTYGMQITAAGSAGEASAVLTTGSTSFGQGKRVSGRYVTVAARVFVPASYTGTPSLVVSDSGGGAQQARADVPSDLRDRFHWLIVTKRVVSPGTSLTVKLATRLSGSNAGSITVDRFAMVEGDLPHEVIAGTPGPVGAAGTALSQMDFISTAGDHPGALMALTSAGAGVIAANSANFWKVRPHRDISVSVLEWQVHTQSGNYDIGIYALDGTRLWSKGSTAVPAAGAVVETVSPAVAFTAGTIYLLAIAFDNTTVLARGAVLGSGNILKLADGSASGFNVATSFPLPSTITPSSSQTNRFQAIAVRSA